MASGEDRLFSIDDLPKRVDAAWRRQPARPKDPFDEAREFGGWTLNKLEVFELYLKMYRRIAGGGSFIDAFAGDGEVRVGDATSEGSAPLALRSGAFRVLHFIEKDPVLQDRLHRYLASHFSKKLRMKSRLYDPADCNRLIPQLLASGEIDAVKPCFVLCDQDSTQLAWETVQRLAEFKTFDAETRRCKVELWILFNTHQVIKRMWPADRARHPTNPFAKKLDFVMGERSAWEDLYTRGEPHDRLMWRYAERLHSELGYRWVHPQVILDPKTRRAQYHMIQASDHPAAIELMRWAKKASMKELSEALALPFGG